MSDASVSFVIPVHNGALYLAESIGSALAQTVPPLEVLVVDDGSDDESAAIALAFGDPVRCVRREHSGQAAARNHGVSLARGELIAFLDADDVAKPQRLERQVARFAARSDLQFCDAYAQNFWSPEISAATRNVAPQEAFTHGDAPKGRLIITWLFRRTLFQRLGGFEEGRRFGEDTEWRDRVDRLEIPRETIEEILAMRRLHLANLTRRHYDSYLQEVLRHSRQWVAQLRSSNEAR